MDAPPTVKGSSHHVKVSGVCQMEGLAGMSFHSSTYRWMATDHTQNTAQQGTSASVSQTKEKMGHRMAQ